MKNTLILICLLSMPVPSWSMDGLFFIYTTAQRLYVDMETCRQKSILCNESEGLLTDKVNGLTSDKEAYRKEAEGYKAAYLKADEARIQSETSQPSRLTWFMTGVLTTLGMIIGITLSN